MKLNYDIIHDVVGVRRDACPIIFLHGIGENRRTWKVVAPIIVKKTRRKAYALDARNHGESPRSKEMNYDALTKDVVDFMDDHGIKKAVIIGHSMGGRTAINFALDYPKRTEVLVVEDMTPRSIKYRTTSVVPELVDLVEEFLKSIPANLDLKMAKETILNLLLDFGGEKLCRADKMIEHYDLDTMPVKKIGDSFVAECDIDAIKLMLKADTLVQNLPETKRPYDGDALFLFGDLGFFKLDKDTTVKKLFPRAMIRKVKDASHWIHHDSPDIFADIVSSFILHRNIQESKL